MILQTIYKYFWKNIYNEKQVSSTIQIRNNTKINNDIFGQYIIIDKDISYDNLNIIQYKKDDLNVCCEIFNF
jgi:hypothetical protein